MQKSLRLLGALALIMIGVWCWLIFFPSPEKAIRSRLNNLANTVSFEPKDGTIARGYSVQKAAGFFTLDVEAQADIRGMQPLHFSGRDEIQQALLWGANSLRGLKVEFLDINVTVEPDKQTAKANLTARWAISGNRDFDVLEFNFLLKKVDGKWLIYRVEMVKTLSLKTSRAA